METIKLTYSEKQIIKEVLFKELSDKSSIYNMSTISNIVKKLKK